MFQDLSNELTPKRKKVVRGKFYRTFVFINIRFVCNTIIYSPSSETQYLTQYKTSQKTG